MHMLLELQPPKRSFFLGRVDVENEIVPNAPTGTNQEQLLNLLHVREPITQAIMLLLTLLTILTLALVRN